MLFVPWILFKLLLLHLPLCDLADAGGLQFLFMLIILFDFVLVFVVYIFLLVVLLLEVFGLVTLVYLQAIFLSLCSVFSFSTPVELKPCQVYHLFANPT